jgi:hypothetical protein
MAEGMSPSSVRRIWNRHGLQPKHLVFDYQLVFSIISAVLPIVDGSSIARLPDRILRGRGSGGAQFTSEEFSTGRRRCTIRRGQGPFL